MFDKAGAKVATMLLNMATLKDSYAPYEEEHRRLYEAGGSLATRSSSRQMHVAKPSHSE